MSVINFNYNSDLVYSTLVDDTIILKNKENDEIVYKFPITKKFEIIGMNDYWGENRPNFVITPYKLDKPKFIPEGYKNLKLANCGLWQATNEERVVITYIDTTLLSEKDFEYSTLGKFKINNDEIPEPFWIPHYNDLSHGWREKEVILKQVRQFHKNARLITEEELISIFSLNSLGFEFWECLSKDIYENSFLKDVEKYCLCANELCMDNWDIVVSSRENRNVYKLISKQKFRDCHEYFWYKNQCFTAIEGKQSPFHIFPVLDSGSNLKEEKGLELVKKYKYQIH